MPRIEYILSNCIVREYAFLRETVANAFSVHVELAQILTRHRELSFQSFIEKESQFNIVVEQTSRIDRVQKVRATEVEFVCHVIDQLSCEGFEKDITSSKAFACFILAKQELIIECVCYWT